MSSITDVGGARPAAEKSTAELVNDLTSQFSHLARTEVKLAVREVQQKARHAGIGVASIGAAGVLALYGLAALLAGAVLALALVVPAWAAALIVAAVLMLVAGVAALIARRELRRGTPPVPAEALAGAKEDVQVVKEAAKR